MVCHLALKWYNKSIMYFNSQMQQRKTRNTSYSNNMESLTLQVDGPINERAYIHGGLITGIFFSVYRLMGL